MNSFVKFLQLKFKKRGWGPNHRISRVRWGC